jgi:hypothetical protein
MSLEDFLDDYSFSPAEKTAIAALLAAKDHVSAAKSLDISSEALRKRLNGVYSKVGITTKGPGKFFALMRVIDPYTNPNQPLLIVQPDDLQSVQAIARFLAANGIDPQTIALSDREVKQVIALIEQLLMQRYFSPEFIASVNRLP